MCNRFGRGFSIDVYILKDNHADGCSSVRKGSESWARGKLPSGPVASLGLMQARNESEVRYEGQGARELGTRNVRGSERQAIEERGTASAGGRAAEKKQWFPYRMAVCPQNVQNL